MNSNEEYLDNLLKSMSEKESAQPIPQVDDTMDLGAIAELLGYEPEEPAAEEAPSAEEVPAVEEILPAEEAPSVEELMSAEKVPSVEELLSAGEMPSVEELMSAGEMPSVEELAPDMEQSAESGIQEGLTVEGTQDLSEEEIDRLLAATGLGAEEETPDEVEATVTKPEDMSNDDLFDLLGSIEDDAELSEISDLLEKSDNNEAVDETILEENNEDAGMEDILALFGEEGMSDTAKEDTDGPTADDGKQGKKVKKEKKPKKEKKAKTEKAPKEESEQKEKKPGFFAKLFSALTEEEEETSEDENQAIIAALEAEDLEEAGKKKKMKKGKMPAAEKKGKAAKGEEAEEGAGKKAKDKKKAKPKKEPKPKKEKPPKEVAEEKPAKRISPKSIFVVVLFAATMFGAVMFASIFLSANIRMKHIRTAFDKKDYMTCYTDLYGMERSEEEEEMFRHAQIVLKVQRKVSMYEQYLEEDNELRALDELMQAVADYDEVYGKAQECGAATTVAALYDGIFALLSDNYGLSQEDARAIARCESNVDYTRYLTALTGGDISEGGGSIELPKEDMQDILPEEEELIAPDFAD